MPVRTNRQPGELIRAEDANDIARVANGAEARVQGVEEQVNGRLSETSLTGTFDTLGSAAAAEQAAKEYAGTLAYGTNLEATDATVAAFAADPATQTGQAFAGKADVGGTNVFAAKQTMPSVRLGADPAAMEVVSIDGANGKRLSFQPVDQGTSDKSAQISLVPGANVSPASTIVSQIELFNKTGADYEKFVLAYYNNEFQLHSHRLNNGVARPIRIYVDNTLLTEWKVDTIAFRQLLTNLANIVAQLGGVHQARIGNVGLGTGGIAFGQDGDSVIYRNGAPAALRTNSALTVDGQLRSLSTVRSQAGETTARPGAAAAGAGAMFFDTTLGKPIWSNGSAWVDASGAAV